MAIAYKWMNHAVDAMFLVKRFPAFNLFELQEKCIAWLQAKNCCQ